MKNIIKPFRFCVVLLALISSSFVAACSDDNEPVEAVVKIPDTVLNAGLTFSSEGGTQKLSIQSNVPLEVSSDQSWCKVEHKSTTANGTSTFEVTMEKNPDTADRTATVTITGGGLSKEVQVRQAATDGLIVAPEEFKDFPAEGGTIQVKLTTNGEVKVTINDSWITESPATRANMQDKTKEFKIAANPGIARTGTITLTLGAIEKQVEVKQLAGGSGEDRKSVV